MFANRLIVKASVVCALAVAALVSPPATKQSSAANSCGICLGDSVCPTEAFLSEYDYQCSVCAYGSYAGACVESVEECNYHPKVLCFYAQRPA